MVLAASTHLVQQHSHSPILCNVSAAFSLPLATLTRQDSRTWPENDDNFMSTLKDGPYHRQLHTDPETAMDDILVLPNPQQRFRIDLAALGPL